MVAANARTAITFSLSGGETHDAPEGRKLLQSLGGPDRPMHLIRDRAYEGDETLQLALDLGFTPVVPPKVNRVTAWDYSNARPAAAPEGQARGCPCRARARGELRLELRQ
jgi:hypothetical protein